MSGCFFKPKLPQNEGCGFPAFGTTNKLYFKTPDLFICFNYLLEKIKS